MVEFPQRGKKGVGQILGVLAARCNCKCSHPHLGYFAWKILLSGLHPQFRGTIEDPRGEGYLFQNYILGL